MAKPKAILAVLSVVLVLACIQTSDCAKKPESGARKEDIPYIKCQVCEKLASQLHSLVQKQRAKIAPKKVFYLYVFLFEFFSLLYEYVGFESSLMVLFGFSLLDLGVRDNRDHRECL